MAILVDPIQKWPSGLWCHLMSDKPGEEGLAELHAMADRLELRRSWFQNDPRHPHYDLRSSKRAQALAYGAEAVSSIELVRRCGRTPRPADLPAMPATEPNEQLALIPDMPAGRPIISRGLRAMHLVYGRIEGKRCGDCAHLVTHRQASTWFKCELSGQSSSAATDWRKYWQACGRYEESTDGQ